MICQFCKDEGAKSSVTPDSYSTSTCMGASPGHYDEAGKWVPGRDPNWHTRGYTCSRGHRYTMVRHDGEPDKVTLISTITVSR